ncbi:uncharacterized protein LOC113295629 [Papaver somniferum]|uniref:uncharacterized protein LOC113295629 n=1 Tax=Papaver somniferum TaxID=3469 RepID=UPI000E6FE8BD|nr:uncharacterized protein LOC113295629 [Papaver somniferum]
MRVLFWNINGVAKLDECVKLRELVKDHKPEVIRRGLWQQLNLFETSPWLIIGDFNCVLRNDENKGGNEPRTSCINEFSDWMEDNNLFEADSLGSRLTWSNGQSGIHRIISKLDRVVINDAWLTKLKQAQLHMEVSLRNSDEDPSDVEKFNMVKDATIKVQDIRMQQNIMLKQKSRNKWLLEGSSNSSFFHNSIQTRRSHNTISELVAEDGTIISEAVQLRDHVVSYYESKFNGDDFPIEDALFNYDHTSITAEESVRMDLVPSFE